ncbi:hypothetical protein M501DRAFT_1007829 [Patellaria atrata CBS 101060]|uniref:Inheritance of peroxisomes protein 1 n=1 Tax=Patellaria atrata CBS 101060 TaxID=1346257 RepID=A0A9P4S3Z1_9PEZI|nr:hypothetical protein M501DRAFT_1007829 [Patellaria atrata CBS 101060]
MSASTPPLAPDNGSTTPARQYGVRRSFTVPAKLAEPTKLIGSNQDPGGAGVETLFSNSFGKVVSFTASTSASGSALDGSKAAGSDQNTTGTLPWGPLRIYRVPGSVSFLNSGKLLHPILPKSQCWCVDGDSVFILRVRMNSYYRIELPNQNPEDKQKSAELKTVLDKVLQYEKTPCPFKREFEVELPQTPETPVKRRPRGTSERAKKWKLDKVWLPEDVENRSDTSSGSKDFSISVHDDIASVKTPSPDEDGLRSISVPSHSAKENLPPTIAKFKPNSSTETIGETSSEASSLDSFYSLNDALSSPPPSPPYLEPTEASGNDFDNQSTHFTPLNTKHKRDISDLTITPTSLVSRALNSPRLLSEDEGTVSRPSTPPLVSDSDDNLELPWSDVPTPPDAIRLRRLHPSASDRGLSPMPHPSVLFSPPSTVRRKQFTAALVQKTCSVLLGPPAHLVAIMLRIAASISNSTKALSHSITGRGNRIPCSWESSEDESSDWEEDDYGIPLKSVNSYSKTTRSRSQGSNWEVD